MDPSDEVTLWKAPQQGRDPDRETRDGFEAERYPGFGPFFTLDRELAEDWQRIYENGLQEFHLPADIFEDLILRGLILSDPYYPERSYRVPPSALFEFNRAIRQGSANVYYPPQRD